MKAQYTSIIKRILFIGLIFHFGNFCLLGQENDTKGNNELSESWLGTWKGELKIYNHKGLAQTVPMQVRHFRTDTTGTYGWYLIYGEEDSGTRPYYLKTVDASKGHYKVDEKNSIFLDTYLIQNKMISTFEVQNNLITSVYTLLENGDMNFEIFFSNTISPLESGNSKVNGEEIPIVYTYPVGGYHKAILKKG